jgi:hypothetical protein
VSHTSSDINIIDLNQEIEQKLWQLVEIYANMDMAQLSVLVTDDILAEFDAQPWSSADRPGDLSSCASRVARILVIFSRH